MIKTVRFAHPVYIGDPLNAVRIFNDKQISELVVLDIGKQVLKTGPDYDFISKIGGECTVPLVYGGGITTVAQAARVFACGVEKISLNTAAFNNPSLISALAKSYGSQSIVVSIDVKRVSNAYTVFTSHGHKKAGISLHEYVHRMQESGCGEILINSIDRDGTMQGYDTRLIEEVSDAVKIPVIACGGAGNTDDLLSAIHHGASAAAAGSMFFFTGRHKAVLINFPSFLTGLNPDEKE